MNRFFPWGAVLRRSTPLLPALLLLGCAGPRPGPPVPERPFLSAAPAIRVGLLIAVAEVQISATASFALTDDEGVIVVGGAGEMFVIRREEESLLIHTPSGELVDSVGGALRLDPRGPQGMITVNGARYPQSVHVIPAPGAGLNVINVVDVETYLRAVVPLEIGHKNGDYLEAAKAQAVAARTYVAAHVNQYPGEGFDVHAGVQDQVYGPVDSRHPNADRAVEETRGMILVHEGRPARTNYASTCGGRTAAVQESFESQPIPYLRSKADEVDGAICCRTSGYFEWEEAWTGDDLFVILSRTASRVLKRPWEGSELRDLEVLDTGPSGRVVELVIETDQTAYTARKGAIRRILETGTGKPLWSNAFKMEVWKKEGRVDLVTVRGKGWGHGVGMCQWGAMQLSREGRDFRRILEHYYPGTEVMPWYPGPAVSEGPVACSGGGSRG